MLHWVENSKKNLLPLSVSTEFHEALKEWFFANEVKDHEEASEHCEMCEHPQLRYHFLIRNQRTEASLWVGSSCILKFDEIEIFNEDESLAKNEERKKRLDDVLSEHKKEQALEPLRLLWQQDEEYRDSITKAANRFKEKGGFNPKFLAVMMARMSERQIYYAPSLYSVYLRSQKAKDDLEEMSPDSFSLILPALSVFQKKRWCKLIEKKCGKSETSVLALQEDYGPLPKGYIWVDGIPI